MTDEDLEDVPIEMSVGYLTLGASATMNALSAIQRNGEAE